jgi:hypothetical protein
MIDTAKENDLIASKEMLKKNGIKDNKTIPNDV